MSSLEATLTMLEQHGVATDRVKAWTICYFPLTVGGRLWRPGGAEIPCDRPIDHKGMLIALCHGPDDMTCVVDFVSGAVVGETLEAVMADIDEGDPEFMKEQVEKACEQRKGMTMMEPDEFWRRIKNARNKK